MRIRRPNHNTAPTDPPQPPTHSANRDPPNLKFFVHFGTRNHRSDTESEPFPVKFSWVLYFELRSFHCNPLLLQNLNKSSTNPMFKIPKKGPKWGSPRCVPGTQRKERCSQWLCYTALSVVCQAHNVGTPILGLFGNFEHGFCSRIVEILQ